MEPLQRQVSPATRVRRVSKIDKVIYGVATYDSPKVFHCDSGSYHLPVTACSAIFVRTQ